MTKEKYYLVTKKELDMIKNDCAHPEVNSCDGCEYADGEDLTRASGLGCNFIGANLLMDEVLERQLLQKHDAEIRKEMIKFLSNLISIQRQFTIDYYTRQNIEEKIKSLENLEKENYND